MSDTTIAQQGMSLIEGLAVAIGQQAEQIKRIESELSELRAEGVPVPPSLTALELWRLEQAGMVFDFTTGQVRAGGI